MKVLHVIPTLSPADGGPTRGLRDAAKGLYDHGIEVSICTTNEDQRAKLAVPLGRPQWEAGATVWYFDRLTFFYTLSLGITGWLVKHIREFDLVHIHCLFSFPSTAAAFIAHKQQVPYIIRPLGTFSHWGIRNRRPLLKQISTLFIERQILQNASLIHFTSEQERDEFPPAHLRTRCVVVPIGIDLTPTWVLSKPGNFKARFAELTGKTLLLFLSRIDPKKGLDLLLPALVQLKLLKLNVALVVAGKGENEFTESLHQKAQKLGIGGDIIWAGFLSGQAKLEALADADVFVLPSYSENFGIAVVEAMASGLPVLISDQVGIHQQVVQAGAGLVVPCQVEALTEALARIAQSPDWRRHMGIRGRQLVEEHFSLESVTRSLIDVYRQVVRQNPEATGSFSG